MTEATYTAWDDNEYLWPPPEGWYQSSDGKWWPEGYGPPAASPAEDADDEPQHFESKEAEPLNQFEDAAPYVPPSGFEPPTDLDHQVIGDAAADDVDPLGVGESPFEQPEPVGPQLFDDSGPGQGQGAGPVSDGDLFDSGRLEDPPADADPLTEESDVVAALVETLAAEDPEAGATMYGAPPTGPPLANTELEHAVESAPETIAIPPSGVNLEFGNPSVVPEFGQAAPISIPDSHEILGAAPKGSSRGLWAALAGAIVLVAIGVGMYFFLGRDQGRAAEDAPIVTGPGSVGEPHARASGVALFYPDGDIDQRWVVEVLEPARDATAERGGSETATFVATRLRIRNESGAELASVGDLRFDVVDASGTIIVRTDNQCPAAADDLNYEASVPVGSTIDGTVCWAIQNPDSASGAGASLDGLKLGIETPKVEGRIHISLQ